MQIQADWFSKTKRPGNTQQALRAIFITPSNITIWADILPSLPWKYQDITGYVLWKLVDNLKMWMPVRLQDVVTIGKLVK